MPAGLIRNDWTREEVATLFDLPFTELVFQAAEIHRAHHAAGEVQLCTLLSIKTGGCPEDCGYCSQSAHAKTGLQAEKLMDADAVLAAAREAKAAGAQRFCMGAAWREPKDRDLPALCEMVREVKALGLETCMTLGMLTSEQAASVLATVHRDASKWTEKQAEAFKQPIRDDYEAQGNPWHATARLWDDGIIDPAQTRDVLGLAFAACLNAPIAARPQFGVFRM